MKRKSHKHHFAKSKLLAITDFTVAVFFVVSLLLLVFYFFAELMLINSKVSPTMITKTHELANFEQIKDTKLLKGETISFVITAKEQNLATIFFRFKKQYRVVPYEKEDLLIVRIKNMRTRKLIQENRYRSGMMKGTTFFPLGVPPIENSKNDDFRVEITSLRGNELNMLEVEGEQPLVVSGYIYPREEILKSRESLNAFLGLKITSSLELIVETKSFLTSLSTFKNFFSFFLPFFYYLVWRIFGSSWKRLGDILLVSLLLFIIIDILDVLSVSSFFLFIYYIVLLALTYLYKIPAKQLFVASLVFFIIGLSLNTLIVFSLFNFNVFQFTFTDKFIYSVVGKVSFWMYMLFLTGIFRSIFELKQEERRFSKKHAQIV